MQKFVFRVFKKNIMRIFSNKQINFQRRLRANEEAEFTSTLSRGKEKLGNTGHSMLILPSASLPQNINTGMGNLLDREGKNFLDFAKQYWGINYVQLLPEGRYKIDNGSHCLPYSGSALDLGTHLINVELLTTEEFGKILSAEDLKLITSNTSTKVNFENVLPSNSPVERTLRKSYNELLKANTVKKREILNEIETFKLANQKWLEPKSIFEALSAKYQTKDVALWNEFDRNFYNTDIVSIRKREQAIEGIKKSELQKEMGFFEFKQFLAQKHLAKAKEELNKKGIKLSGDALAGFSFDEIWANPKGFLKGYTIGYGLPVLDFESPEAENLLRQKFNNFAKRYDGIRVDMSWSYITQPIEDSATKKRTHKEYGDKILSIIEDEIKKVKGQDFNLENITHEMVADEADFNLFQGNKIQPFLEKRNKIFCTMNLNENWATVENFRKRGWQDGTYLLGVTNHDSETIRETFANIAKRNQQIEALSKILKIPKEKISTLQDFIQAKFAEPMRSKHNMFFFSEALNLSGKYKDVAGTEDYRLKIPKNYQEEYFKALEKGEGFNIMDALEKAFVAEGLDKKEPDLYKKIIKYRKILQSKETSGNKWYSISIGVGIGLLAGAYIIYKKRAGNPDSNVR